LEVKEKKIKFCNFAKVRYARTQFRPFLVDILKTVSISFWTKPTMQGILSQNKDSIKILITTCK